METKTRKFCKNKIIIRQYIIKKHSNTEDQERVCYKATHFELERLTVAMEHDHEMTAVSTDTTTHHKTACYYIVCTIISIL